MEALKIIQMDIAKIRPSDVNSRLHSPEQISQIQASIKQFGFVSPCLIDQNDTLIAGHGRLDSARRLGMKKVPVIRLSHLSDDQARALRIADNAIPLNATWDVAMLETELAALSGDFDMVSLGLTEIALPDLGEVESEPRPPRAPRKSTTLFVTIANADAERARKTIAAALDKLKISHTL